MINYSAHGPGPLALRPAGEPPSVRSLLLSSHLEDANGKQSDTPVDHLAIERLLWVNLCEITKRIIATGTFSLTKTKTAFDRSFVKKKLRERDVSCLYYAAT